VIVRFFYWWNWWPSPFFPIISLFANTNQPEAPLACNRSNKTVKQVEIDQLSTDSNWKLNSGDSGCAKMTVHFNDLGEVSDYMLRGPLVCLSFSTLNIAYIKLDQAEILHAPKWPRYLTYSWWYMIIKYFLNICIYWKSPNIANKQHCTINKNLIR
jgi:hypothetical protein